MTRRRFGASSASCWALDFESNFYALADVSGARGFVPKADLAGVEFTMFWPPTRSA